MLSEIILPVGPPLINGYSHFGSVFSIIATDEESFKPWFLSRFAQLFSTSAEKNKELFVNMDEPEWFPNKTDFCPLLNINIVDKSLIENRAEKGIIDGVLSLIKEGYYIYLVLDQRYIPGSYGFGKYSFPHDTMIYGFNTKKKILHIADNLSGKYQFSQCSFSQFELAYYSMAQRKDRLGSRLCLIQKKPITNVKFDLLRLVDTLYGYWQSASPEIRSSNWHDSYVGCIKGLDVYSNIIKYIQLLNHKEVGFDIRPFHALWEHKKLMVLRIKYMYDTGILKKDNELLQSYINIETTSIIHRNMMIKYEFTRDLELTKTIIQQMNEIEQRERQLIPKILENIVSEDHVVNNKILGLGMNPKLRWSLS